MSEHQQIKDLEERFARGEISRREFMIAVSALGVTMALGISPNKADAATATVSLSGTASGFIPNVFIEDVFSTFTYTGTGATQTIANGINLQGPTQQEATYTTPGTYSWVCPVGVTSVSVVCVGAGGAHPTYKFAGGGGGLGYKNNYSVTPGNSYTVVVGAGTIGLAGGDSYFVNTTVVKGGGGQTASGGSYTGDGGGNGGSPGSGAGAGGGGAGGYGGTGGNGGTGGSRWGAGTNGAGGGGGGGAGADWEGGGGGGVGILGQGANGAGSSSGSAPFTEGYGYVGEGGSRGENPTANSQASGNGAVYGGGSGDANSRPGANGAVRIIWPGSTRQFPSTAVGQITDSSIGGLVWTKNRSNTDSHNLTDTVRGTGLVLSTNQTTGSGANTSAIRSFSSTGYTVAEHTGTGASGNNYVSWTFKKSPKFFDIVTYTGNGANRTIAHSLGAVPGMIMVKRTEVSGNDWEIYHRSFANTEYAILNSTAAKLTSAARWNSTTATSSVFSLGTETNVNNSGSTYIAYLFAHDAGADGVIQCGTYTGNGSVANATVEQNGPTINLGWEPQWILVKSASTSAMGWYIIDDKRTFSIDVSSHLSANTAGSETNLGPTYKYLKPTSSGFKITAGTGAYFNETGVSYIYVAIRRGPMRTPTAGTQVYNAIARAGTGAAANVTGVGFAPDLLINKNRDGVVDTTYLWSDRLRGAANTIDSASMSVEQLNFPSSEFRQNGFYYATGAGNNSGQNRINWFFRRAPGFFDEVCYTGTGSATTQTHNLGVVPELIIVKSRSSNPGANWPVYTTSIGATKYLYLNDPLAASTFSTWNDTTPTATAFSLSNYQCNGSGVSFVAYLFASCPGVSKIGTYTGNGSATGPTVTTNFQPRWLMVKRTDSTGNWCVWDSARSTSNPRQNVLFLNTTDAETTSGYDVDFNASTFQIKSTNANVNANTGTYLYFAIS